MPSGATFKQFWQATSCWQRHLKLQHRLELKLLRYLLALLVTYVKGRLKNYAIHTTWRARLIRISIQSTEKQHRYIPQPRALAELWLAMTVPPLTR